MQTKWDFAGSTDMWSTSAGGHLMKVANLTGFTVLNFIHVYRCGSTAQSRQAKYDVVTYT
jgi:hypothetical protein